MDNFKENGSKKDIEAVETKYPGGIDSDVLKNSDYYKEVSAYGKSCQADYVSSKWVRA